MFWLIGSKRTRPGSRAKRTSEKMRSPVISPWLERLEERALLSVLVITGGTATYTASNAIRNNLSISLDGANYLIVDSAENITVAGSGSAGCTGSGSNLITCPAANIDRFAIFLEDLDDSLRVNSIEADASVTANGGSGNDTLVAAPGAAATVVNLLRGDDGNDVLTGGPGADTIVGGNGNDTMNGAGGIDLLDYSSSPVAVRVNLMSGKAKGPGKDLVSAMEDVLGSNFSDSIAGNDVANRLDGGLGNDKLSGNGGDDILIGGLGNDALSGGIGADNLNGGDGNDRLAGGMGNDILTGGAGKDMLTGGFDNDMLFGGDGNDTLTGSQGADELRGEAGIDVIIRDPADTVVDFGPQP